MPSATGDVVLTAGHCLNGVTSRGAMDENGVAKDLSAALLSDAVHRLYSSAGSL